MTAPSPALVRKFRRVLCVVALAAGTLLGCRFPRGASVSVTPASSLFDQPVHIVVSGLDPSHTVTVGLRSADAYGHVWTSQAVFRPNGSGAVDLASTRR